MIYLRRKIDVYLREWKEDRNRKPLIVKGARQDGINTPFCKSGI